MSAGVRSAGGQQQATQTVRIEVVAARQAAASPVVRVGNAASQSGQGSLSLFTSESNQKITASLDCALPAGASMHVAVRTPRGAMVRTSLDVDVATDLVTMMPIASTEPMTVTVDGIAHASGRLVRYTVTTAP